MNRNELSLSDVCAELEGIALELSALSTLFDEDASKLLDRPTDYVIRESLFAISRHIERCENDIDRFESNMLQSRNEARKAETA